MKISFAVDLETSPRPGSRPTATYGRFVGKVESITDAIRDLVVALRRTREAYKSLSVSALSPEGQAEKADLDRLFSVEGVGVPSEDES